MPPTLLLTRLAAAPQGPLFEAPVRMQAGGSYVKVESPGYARPSWHDVDGDGLDDLVVGQFHDGKMRLFKGEGGGKLAAGAWLRGDKGAAVVPDVW
ncbi:MAG: hypothetical protein ACK5BN_20635 [Planctomycetota bacterium]